MKASQLEEKIGYNFRDKKLLKQALAHRSYLNEHPEEKLSSNERLEFLGDAVLELVISELVFDHFPDQPEGVLTALRSRLVRTESLAEIAQSLSLGEFLLLSRGEEDGGGRANTSLLANAFEAIIGALYKDEGVKIVSPFIEKYFKEKITKAVISNLKDNKSLLQEQSQEKDKITPIYKVLSDEGPDHAKIFTVGVFLRDKMLSEGEGKSKQEAEEKAAKIALEKYYNL